MSTASSITDMEPGDYVKVAPGEYLEIASIQGVTPEGKLERHFSVTTTDGRVVDMYEALRYYKRDECRLSKSD